MRNVTDFSGVFKECAWLLGCAATALVLPRLGLEDKGNQTLFVTVLPASSVTLGPLGHHFVAFLGKTACLRNKQAAGRPKDIADIDALEPGRDE
jgi:hypothetical protein